jgi:hypothetical protein
MCGTSVYLPKPADRMIRSGEKDSTLGRTWLTRAVPTSFDLTLLPRGIFSTPSCGFVSPHLPGNMPSVGW